MDVPHQNNILTRGWGGREVNPSWFGFLVDQDLVRYNQGCPNTIKKSDAYVELGPAGVDFLPPGSGQD